MKESLAPLLRAPGTRRKLRLEVFRSGGGEVLEGVLWDGPRRWFPIIDGVPRLVEGQGGTAWRRFGRKHRLPPLGSRAGRGPGEGQKDTIGTFSDKWSRFKDYGMKPREQAFLLDWMRRKMGFRSKSALLSFYSGKRLVLEAGTGSGYHCRAMASRCRGTVIGADLSEAALTTHGNTRDLNNCHAVQADLTRLPFDRGIFDLIVTDGVLHHTPDTRRSLDALYGHLAPGGHLFFYVYRKMGAARQFVDAHVRGLFGRLDPEACYEACKGLTDLGRELSALKRKIRLTRAIPSLGIPAGRHDVQRLIYYNFAKCFWNPAFDYATNNMVNFDWYHPHFAWQHDEAEVKGWLRDLGVRSFRINPANPNGISVLLRKPFPRRGRSAGRDSQPA